MQTEKITTERTSAPDSSNAKGISITSQHYLHNAKEGALVPLLKSVITGLVFGLPATLIAHQAGSMDWWFIGLVTWFVVQAIVWLAAQTHIVMLSIWALEAILNKDFDGDGVRGNPNSRKPSEPLGVKVTLRHVNENGHISHSRYVVLQGDPVSIWMFTSAVLKGSALAERAWMGEGKPFSPTEFRENMRILKQEKLIELKNSRNENDGYRLTPEGVGALEDTRDQIMAHISPPPPG